MGEDSSYVGTWILVPELCLYEEGAPPRSGIYRIAEAGDEVSLSIEWEAGDGTTHQVAFAAPSTGVCQPASAPGGPSLSITRISASVLDSRAFMGDREVAYARRTVSADRLLLSTVQVGHGPSGTPFRNFQVYRRQG